MRLRRAAAWLLLVVVVGTVAIRVVPARVLALACLLLCLLGLYRVFDGWTDLKKRRSENVALAIERLLAADAALTKVGHPCDGSARRWPILTATIKGFDEAKRLSAASTDSPWPFDEREGRHAQADEFVLALVHLSVAMAKAEAGHGILRAVRLLSASEDPLGAALLRRGIAVAQLSRLFTVLAASLDSRRFRKQPTPGGWVLVGAVSPIAHCFAGAPMGEETHIGQVAMPLFSSTPLAHALVDTYVAFSVYDVVAKRGPGQLRDRGLEQLRNAPVPRLETGALALHDFVLRAGVLELGKLLFHDGIIAALSQTAFGALFNSDICERQDAATHACVRASILAEVGQSGR